MQGWKGNVLALFAGALMPLAFAPFSLYPLALLSLLLLFLSWDAVTAKQAAWRGWLFGLGMFGVGVSWIFVAIHVFGQSGVILAALLTFLFVGFLAMYLALLGFLLKKLSPNAWCLTDHLLLLPVSWLGFEFFKGWFLTGFPWLNVGVSQIEGPLAGYVPVIGISGVSLLLAMSASVLLLIIKQRRWSWVIPLFVVWTVGASLNNIDWTKPVGEPIDTVIIQGNIPQQIKWQPEQVFNTLLLYQNMTRQHWDADLVVWPENALPVFYHQLQEFYLQPLAEEARKYQTDILLGLPVSDEDNIRYYNSMLSLGSEQAFYHKRQLVPFGDYVPFERLRGLIAFFDLPMSAFVPGPEQQPLLQVAGHKVGVSICYEDVFSSQVLQTVPEAGLLVNATNNAWYGDSFAPHQHLQISRSRALETGRPLVRATTNGISAFVNFKGEIESQTPQFERASLTQSVQPRQGKTPYVSLQNWPIWLLSLLMLCLWAYYRHKKSD